jgi:hypothetical protein
MFGHVDEFVSDIGVWLVDHWLKHDAKERAAQRPGPKQRGLVRMNSSQYTAKIGRCDRRMGNERCELESMNRLQFAARE